MFYDFVLTIPANTPVSKPVASTGVVCPGRVDRVMIIFPPGAAGLAHIRIARGSHQLWPSNLDGSFASDGEFLDFSENYPLDDSPFEFIISGWNDDDTYDHSITVRFNIVPVEQAAKPGLTDQIKTFLGVGRIP